MSQDLNSYSDFRFLRLSQLNIILDESADGGGVTELYTISEGNLGNGSTAQIEEIKINGFNVGVKHTITIDLANSDYGNIELLSKTNKYPVQNITYVLATPNAYKTEKQQVTLTISGTRDVTISSRLVESEYNTVQFTISIIDTTTHISDIIIPI